MDERMSSILRALAFNAPLYIAWLVGLILAIVNWKKMPRASLFTVIAFGLFLVNVAGNVFWMNYSISEHEKGVSYATIGIVTAGINFISILLASAWWGLLLAAIFGRRSPRQAGNVLGEAIQAAPGGQV